MMIAINNRQLLPILVMLLALTGLALSMIGEASSHGVAAVAELPVGDHDRHSHGHDDVDEEPTGHVHHDSGNHTHDTIHHLTIRLLSRLSTAYQQPTPYTGDPPRSVRTRLDRPPKTAPTV
ncbi:hypothetical protein [Allohahella marinimesophila]|uniref:Secreted protein n=1 Tax=Allohahella marinimesophila TaxID=1054972 RepID=A0ABP7NX53_9GAMM